MAMDTGLANDVAAVRHLQGSEARLREAARLLDLLPSRADDARRLFDLANRVRAERLELLDRCQLR